MTSRVPLRAAISSLAAASLLALAACSSADTTTNSAASGPASAAAADVDLTGAQKQLDQYSQPFTWKDPGPAFDAAGARGKRVVYIPVDNSIPFFAPISNQMKEAFASVGVDFDVCDGKGNPGQWATCIDDAVGRKAGAIIIDSFTTSSVQASLDKARAAGVKIIDGNNGDPGTVPPAADARVSFPYSLAGRLVSDWIIADSGGNANVLIIQSPESGNVPDLVGKGYKAELTDKCPTTCKVKVADVSFADWATRLQSTVQSQLAADPTINYVIPIYDGMSTYVVPGIQAAGATGKVKVATFNANLDPMKKMAAGGAVSVDVGSSQAYEGWAYADQALRLITGQQPLGDQLVPVRVFTAQNVDQLQLTREAELSGEWFGDSSYKDEYKKLWRVG
jgi:ribose transport system substrate-binding protein